MPAIEFQVKEFIATITLNRPEAFNSINSALAHELISALDECKSDEVRVVVLTGAGKAFCAGQDLKEVTDPSVNPGFEVLMKEHYEPLVSRLRGLEKPIIAAVNGVAAGAGANIALACDIVIATESASFIQAFSAIGLIPDSGGTYTLPRAIGLPKAAALAMLGDKVPAKEAEQMGMIYKCFPNEEFVDAVSKIAIKLSRMAPIGLSLTKQAFNASLSNTFEEQMALETELQLRAAATSDYEEGVAAFVEKRLPNFKGE